MNLKNRGIILVSTLFFVAMIVMFAVIITQQARMALDSGRVAAQSEKAYMAALSGIEFAKCQIGKNSSWGANGFSNSSKHIFKGLDVEYDIYGLKGYIGKDDKGEYESTFDISFDSFGKCPYRSCNNINSSSKVLKDISYRRDIPAGSLYIVSKGMCGKHVKYVEALICSKGYKASGVGTIARNGISVFGIPDEDYTANALLCVKNVDPSKSGMLTSFGSGSEISVQPGSSVDPSKLVSFNNNLIVNSPNLTIGSYKYSDNNKKNIPGVTVNASPESDPSYFDSVDSYENAAASAENDSFLPAGAYVFINCNSEASYDAHENGSAVNKSRWVFLPSAADMSNSDIINLIESSADIPETRGISFSRNEKSDYNGGVVLDGAVKCKGDVKFTVINKTPEGYSGEDSKKTVDFYMRGNDESEPMLLSDGDIFIDGEISGNGKLYAKGNIQMNAGSSFETKRNSGVGIYAEGDVSIMPAKNVSIDSYNEAVSVIAASEGASDAVADEAISILTNGELSNSEEKTPSAKNEKDTHDNKCVTISNATDRNGVPLNMELSLEAENKHFNEKNDKVTITIKKAEKTYVYSEKRGNFSDGADKSLVKTFIFQETNNGNKNGANKNGGSISLIALPIWGDNNNTDGGYYGCTSGSSGCNYGLFTLTGDYICEMDVRKGNEVIWYKTPEDKKAEYSKYDTYHDIYPSYKTAFKDLELRDAVDDTKVTGHSETAEKLVDNIRQKISDGTEIKGTVFSKGNINIHASGFNFSVTGSLVAPNGRVCIDDAKRVSLTFDPDYSSFFENTGIVPEIVFILAF